MRWINISLVITSIVVSFILCISNWQPLNLFFLGNSSQTALFSLSLPLAIWILLFTLAGLITGFIIQLLNRIAQPSSPSRRPRKSFDSPSPKTSPQGDPYIQDRNWDNNLPDEWDIEEPPKQATQTQYSDPYSFKFPKTTIQDNFKGDSSQGSSPPPQVSPPSENKPSDPPRSSEFEVSQSPKRASHEGSVYTYTYREKRNSDSSQKSPPSSTESNPSQVYDASYRVITPPHQEPENDHSQGEEEEDWI